MTERADLMQVTPEQMNRLMMRLILADMEDKIRQLRVFTQDFVDDEGPTRLTAWDIKKKWGAISSDYLEFSNRLGLMPNTVIRSG